MKLQKYAENPVVSPHPDHTWENLSVCNPGAWYEDGMFYLLYRAAGDDEQHVIHFGLATSEDGFQFTRHSDKPVLSPSDDGPDGGCIEDPRIVKMGNHYFITYAYRPYPPGRYWLNKNNNADSPGEAIRETRFLAENLTNSGLLLSKDLISYKRLGRITKANLDDRDVIVFPEKVGGRYVMLHRPKEWVGEGYETEYPAMWICFSDDLLVWKDSSLLITGAEDWERKIGGSTPPLRTDRGWLTLYHGVDDNGIYRIGALMLDLENPTMVLARTRDYIMEPEFDYEFEGLYSGVVFPTGNVIVGETLYVYYGGADKYCGVATCKVNDLVDFVFSNSR